MQLLKTLKKKGIGFKTVAETLAFLKAKSSISFSLTKPDGWIIANDSEAYTVRSFTPDWHPAHPAVLKRELKHSEKGDVDIEMSAFFQAEKKTCDTLMKEFDALNSKVRTHVQNQLH